MHAHPKASSIQVGVLTRSTVITVVATSLALLLVPAEAGAFSGQAAAFSKISVAAKRLDVAAQVFASSADRCNDGSCLSHAIKKLRSPASKLAHAVAHAAKLAPAGSQCQKRLNVSADDIAQGRNAISALGRDFANSDAVATKADLAKFTSALKHFTHDFKAVKKNC